MSRYLLPRLETLCPYEPGEQPQDRRYIKLNTNENPFPPSPRVLEALQSEEALALNLYPDPTNAPLLHALAKENGVRPEDVFVGNGSDEVLGFAFEAYADATHPVVVPEITYSFYEVFAALYGAPLRRVPLNEDWSMPVERLCGQGCFVALANPNAPTALALKLDEVERIVAGNPGQVVLVDEAYVDFGGESCAPLLARYDNLLIVRTFSKSRSLAGARLGYALGNRELIEDLNRVKNSFHPYNINRLTMAAGVAALEDESYFVNCVRAVCRTRDWMAEQLRARGFLVTDSRTNFLFYMHPSLPGGELAQRLREKGVLVRHFDTALLCNHIRMSIGAEDEMYTVLGKIDEILKEAGICCAR